MRTREVGRSCACGRGAGRTSGTVLLGSRRLGGRPSTEGPKTWVGWSWRIVGWGSPGGRAAWSPRMWPVLLPGGVARRLMRGGWTWGNLAPAARGWSVWRRAGGTGRAGRFCKRVSGQDASRRSVCLGAFPEMCGPGWKDELLLAEHRGAAAGGSCSEEACGRGFGLSAPGPKAAQPRETQQRRAG